MREPVPNIDCPIDLFPRQERKIQELIRWINEAHGIERKAELAPALRDEAEVLLGCSAFDAGNINCVSCRGISSLRSKTATLILKTDRALNRTPEA